MAISMRLNTRRRTAVAAATGLPRYARNDKVATLAMTKWVRMRRCPITGPVDSPPPLFSRSPPRHSGPEPESRLPATYGVPAIPGLLGLIRRRIRRAADNLNAPPHRQQAVRLTAAMLKCTNRPVETVNIHR